MRPLIITLLLALSSILHAQTAAARFRTDEQQWTAHRPDGMTWDDGTPEAAQALDAMWNDVIDAANEFLITHPAATPGELKARLEALKPVTDARFGNDLSASVTQLGERLYAVAFNDFEAGTVFVLRPGPGATGTWQINNASAQGVDVDNLLRAWQSSRADVKCGDREPNSIFVTCGPLVSSVGRLPSSNSGAPRFYVSAYYGKDAGASLANQLSVWEWEGSAPALLWIGRYITHAEATRPLRVRGSSLSFGVQDSFDTFFACMSCDGRQLLHRLQLTGTGIVDQGLSVLYPELDRVDALLGAIAKNKSTIKLATPEVVESLQSDIRKAVRFAKGKPGDVSFGMLEDWSVTRGDGHDENICIDTDGLRRLDFTYDPTLKGGNRFTSLRRNTGSAKRCPTKNAIHLPFTDANNKVSRENGEPHRHT